MIKFRVIALTECTLFYRIRKISHIFLGWQGGAHGK